jgi:2-dehydropantoate 2-reductase
VSTAPLAVLGVGGVGGLLAAKTEALCIGRERTVEAIREGGLRLVRGGMTTVVHPEATTRLDRPVALLVVAYDLDAALDRVSPEALDGALILPLLNGLEHVEAIRERLGGASYSLLQARPVVAAGSIGRVSAASPEPGLVVVQTERAGRPRIAAASQDLGVETLAGRLEPLAEAGLELVLRPDERDVLWEKAVRLAVLAAATVASGLPVGALREDPVWRGRMQTALEEAIAVAAADGVLLAGTDQWAIIQAMPPELTTSAARDAAAGRQTELDAISGSVVRAGRRLGVEAPVLDALLEEARCRAR